MLTPGRERGRLALANRRPRPTGLAGDVQQRDQEEDRAHDHRVAVVRGVAHGPRRAPHRRGARGEGARPRRAGESPTAAREVDHREHDRHGAGEHQRDQREVEAGDTQRGQPDEHTDRHRHEARRKQEHRERESRRVRKSRAHPAAEGEQRHLAERDHPDTAVEDAEAERGDGVDRHAREGGDPVGPDERRHREHDEREQARDDHAANDDTALEAPDRDSRARYDRWTPGPRSRRQFAVREIETTRRREITSSAAMARTNGADER